MEIIHQNYTDFFANLNTGDVFLYDDTDVFFRISTRTINDEWFNAVNLNNGELYHFERNDNVRKVNARLTIN